MVEQNTIKFDTKLKPM